jgi:hypothetical protein
MSSQSQTTYVSLIARPTVDRYGRPLGELTASPSDFNAVVGDTVVWDLFVADEPKLDPVSGALTVTARKISVPFLLKFDPGNGFDDVEVVGSEGHGQTMAAAPGVYHYEVAFTFEGTVYALLGCPSGTVHPNK